MNDIYDWKDTSRSYAEFAVLDAGQMNSYTSMTRRPDYSIRIITASYSNKWNNYRRQSLSGALTFAPLSDGKANLSVNRVRTALVRFPSLNPLLKFINQKVSNRPYGAAFQLTSIFL